MIIYHVIMYLVQARASHLIAGAVQSAVHDPKSQNILCSEEL